MTYLHELEEAGFEVDYTDSLDDLTSERLRSFNTIVLFESPDAVDVADHGKPSDPTRVRGFVDLVEGYIAAGGGALLMPGETNVRKQRLSDLTDRWGANVLGERIDERDSSRLARMPHSSRDTKLAFTDRVARSPITEGVRGIWYPCGVSYRGPMTSPLAVNDAWQVLVRASATATTETIALDGAITAPPGLLQLGQPEPSPPIMAVRGLLRGRIALIAEWPQFSVGAGTKWIYDRDVLDRGLAGRPSDFGRLLTNTLRWLSQPSLTGAGLGGWHTNPQRLLPPNARDEVQAEFRAAKPSYDASALAHVAIPTAEKLYRGLIGARTSYSSGKGSVSDYARAARESGLDFVVFLEEFDHMSKEKLEALTADCMQKSGPDLLLLPGFSIRTNIGNRVFFFSPHPQWPPDDALTGPAKTLLYLQGQSPDGSYTGYRTPFLPWVLDAYSTVKGQVGYYDFIESPHGMRLHDARLYGMVGLRYYRNGKLIEDVLDDYLTTASSTNPPAPVSIDEVDSPEGLVREAKSNRSFTFAWASSLSTESRDGIFFRALRWSHQYDAMPVFASSGPKVYWAGCHRVVTYGAEGFVPEKAAQQAPLVVLSDVGLEEIKIFDGEGLFRRFLLGGSHRFEQQLVLDDAVQRNLVVVARDRQGGVAVTFPRRSWSEGSLAPVFCSDHINDCGPMRLAHGPFALPLGDSPSLPAGIAGWTWDGGPQGSIPAVGTPDALPEFVVHGSLQRAARLDQIPILEFSDDGAVGVETIRRDAYDPRLLAIVNPWNTFGPIMGPDPLFETTQHYREWVAAPHGAPPTGWAALAERAGSAPSLFRSTVTFHEAVTVESLTNARLRPVRGATIVVPSDDDDKGKALDLSTMPDTRIATNRWFAVYGPAPSNAFLYENRGRDVWLRRSNEGLDIVADFHDRAFRRDETYTFESSAMGFPLDESPSSVNDVMRYASYLAAPTGLRVYRGMRIPSAGLLEVAVDGAAAEVALPRARDVSGITLPLRVSGLNPRWSAGLLQKEGYSAGFYGSGRDRYRSVGLDADGYAYVPLYVDRADATQVLIGHPIVADGEGRALFIDVTSVGGTPPQWHVSVNNPDDRPITTTMTRALDLPGLSFARRTVTIPSGGYVVLQ